MSGQFNVAVVGATGLVGEALLAVLAERKFPVGRVHALASPRSVGKRLPFKDGHVTVEALAGFDFRQTQIGLFSAGGALSERYAPEAAAAGCVVIDNTSCFRYDDDVPLVVPEVNPQALGDYVKRNLIANPNCSTIQMVVALKPIYDRVGIERINVATYQAVSGAGRRTVETLAQQSAGLLNGRDLDLGDGEKPLAFNALPSIGAFQDNGYTLEEMKMVWETQKILEDPRIRVNPTAVRVPVFYGHSEAVHIETRDPITVTEARNVLASAPGVELLDGHAEGQYPTAVTEAANRDAVYVGRLRADLSHERGLNLWIVADNVRKGAALNSVQIAEILVKDYL